VIISAHLGHWYVQLAFAVPALVIIGYMSRDSIKRRRDTERRKHDDEPRSGASPPSRS
jgi:hypothetical protein